MRDDLHGDQEIKMTIESHQEHPGWHRGADRNGNALAKKEVHLPPPD